MMSLDVGAASSRDFRMIEHRGWKPFAQLYHSLFAGRCKCSTDLAKIHY